MIWDVSYCTILLPKFLLMNCQELILFERLTQWVDLIFLSLISSHDTLKEHKKENLQKQIIFSPLALEEEKVK